MQVVTLAYDLVAFPCITVNHCIINRTLVTIELYGLTNGYCTSDRTTTQLEKKFKTKL